MSVISVHRPRIKLARTGWSELAMLTTYVAALAGIYLSVGFLYYYAAKEKLIDNSGMMPAGLRKEFAGSLFASVPGDNASWVLLGALEAGVVILLAMSLIRGEFLTSRRKPLLLAGLAVSMLTLGVMSVANNMVGDFATAMDVFTYFGLTAVLMLVIHQLPPYRSLGWLAGAAEK